MLGENGQWIGPPVLILRLRLGARGELVLDGRKRLAEHRARALTYEPPTYVATSHAIAVRELIRAQHYDRAAEHVLNEAPHLKDQSASALARAIGVTKERLIPYQRALKDPHERHKRPRRTVKVLQRVLKLRELALSGSAVTLADLEWAAEGFIED